MNKLKNIFDFLFSLIIIFIFAINIHFLEYLSQNRDIATMIFLLQAVIVVILVQKVYVKPINELTKSINKFITGKSNDDGKIKIKSKSPNPNIKRILKFFDVILTSLSSIKEELLSGKAIKGEVELAQELQGKLLNKKLQTIPSLDVIAKSVPAGEIGGDSYDIIMQDDNYYIYVGDATGHGVGAGFVMMMVNALVSGFSKVFLSGAQILAYTNEILKPRIKSNILMSLLMVRWDQENKRMFMTGAGHEYLIIYKHSKKKCFKVKSGGMALGMTKNVHKILKEQEIKFEEDDIIVLYSDGITEAINRPQKDGKEEMFGELRLVEAIEKSPTTNKEGIKTSRSVFNNITIELSKFMGYKYVKFDDITLVVIHYRGDKTIEEDFPEKIHEDFITEWNWN